MLRGAMVDIALVWGSELGWAWGMINALVESFAGSDDGQLPVLSCGQCRRGLARHRSGRVLAKIRRIRPMKVCILRYPRDVAGSISRWWFGIFVHQYAQSLGLYEGT